MSHPAVTPAVTHYRRLPALTRGFWEAEHIDYPADRQDRCNQLTGHILVVRDNRIVCVECGADWKDEGF